MVIDFHTHVFPSWLRGRREEYLARDATFGALYASPKAKLATAEELITSMDAADVDISVMAGIGWTDAELARRCNDYLLEQAARYPRRLVSLCGASPAWDESTLAKELERCAAGGARGVGEMHPDSQGFDIAIKDATATLMELARRLGLLVLTHASESVGHQYPGKGSATPEKLCAFIQAYPKNTIVLAHWGGGLPFYALMPEVGAALANVYFDTAASPFLYQQRIFKLAPEAAGYGRVLFGSDYPLLAQARVLGQLREAALPPDAEGAIAGGNAARLLGIERR